MKNAIMQLCIGVAIPTDSGNSLILNAKGAVQIQSGPPRPIGNYEIFIANLWVFSVEGSHLESEPSMKMGISVEGSVLDIGRLASIAAMLYRIVGMFAE